MMTHGRRRSQQNTKNQTPPTPENSAEADRKQQVPEGNTPTKRTRGAAIILRLTGPGKVHQWRPHLLQHSFRTARPCYGRDRQHLPPRLPRHSRPPKHHLPCLHPKTSLSLSSRSSKTRGFEGAEGVADHQGLKDAPTKFARVSVC